MAESEVEFDCFYPRSRCRRTFELFIELVEETGGKIHMENLPVGDPTLSAKEIVGNESQERMGLVMKEKDVAELKRIADRERAPMYVIGETTGDMKFTFENAKLMRLRSIWN